MSEEARGYLDLRIDDLDLSARATKLCAFMGIGSLGELVQARASDMERVPNCGRKTIAEIEEKLAQFDLSLGMHIADWDPSRRRPKNPDGTLSLPPPRPPRVVVSRNAANLEQELRDFAGLIAQGRNLDIVTKLWGFGGQGRRTLESLGEEYEMTRERVRQIAQKVERRLRRYNVDTPWLARAVDVVAELSPALPQELARQLRARGVAQSDFDVAALGFACELVGRRFPFTTRQYGRTELVVRVKDDDKIAEFYRAARKLTASQGCANFEAVCDDLSIEAPDRTRIETCVASLDCVWLDRQRGWFMATGTARNRLVNLASKVFWVAPEVSVSEMRKAVAKEPRLASVPPIAVIARFLEATGIAHVKGDIATLKLGVDVSEAIGAGGVEETLIRALREEGPVLGWDKFQDASMARGVNPTSFGIYASKSPVIARLARGVYAPVGEPVPPGVVEEISAEVAAARKPAEWGWLPRGTLWCAIPLNTTVLTAGRTSIPSFVYEYAEGEWAARMAGRTLGEQIKCGNGFIWGFRRTLVNAGAEAGDMFVVEFDAAARIASLYLGDDELVDAFEAGKPPPLEGDDEDE
ncbi:MAG: DNA-directed RNA polymerase subunit alpha C-terminal domain-containing protein [Hyphomonadaceae bacterium]